MPIIVDPAVSTGSSVELSAVFLNTADNPADFIAVEYAGEALSVNTSARVEVRQLIGRRRLIRTGAATTESFGVTFERCTAEQVAWLRSHVGTLVCVRDHVGNKFYGVYTDAPREVDTAFRDRVSVRVQIESVTLSEAV